MKKQPQIIIKPYKRKKKKKRLKRYFLVILTFLIFFTLSLYFLLSWLVKKESGELEKQRLNNQILRSEIKRFQSSNEAYEEYIRTKMGYIKEGEKLIIYSENTKR